GVDAGSLIGVDAGSLIGVDAGSLIGVDAGSLIGVDAGSLTARVELPAGLVSGRSSYRLANLVPAAGVRVYVRDARGRFFIGPDGKLVSAVTGPDGVVTFPGYRAARGLSLHVPLDAVDGVLRGFAGLRPRTQPAGVPVAVTPATTLLTGWVETRILATQPDPAASLDRLTPEAATQAEQAAGQALSAGALAGSAWRPDTLAEAAEAAGQQDATLASALQEVRRVMTLAGVDPCQEGSLATQTPLNLPIAVAVTEEGDIFLASDTVGGIARIGAADGRITFNAGPCMTRNTPGQAIEEPPFEQLVAAPDGWLYAASFYGRGVWRLRPPGGRPEQWLGGGGAAAAPGLAGRDVLLHAVRDITPADEGGLWVADQPEGRPPFGGRLLRFDRHGTLQEVWRDPSAATREGGGEARLPEGRLLALAASPGGVLWGLSEGFVRTLWRRAPGQEGFTPIPIPTLASLELKRSRLLAMPDGAVLLSTSDGERNQHHQVLRISPEGGVTTFAGQGPAAYDAGVPTLAQAHLNHPAGLALDRQGRVLVADYGNALLRRLDPTADRVEALAGGRATDEALALQAKLNLPVGLAFEPNGRLLVSELGGNTLRRLDGDTLRRLAGGLAGVAGSGSPTPADRLGNPTALATSGTHVFLVELVGPRLRRLDLETGLIETLTGSHQDNHADALRNPTAAPKRLNWDSITGLCVDAQGRPVFAAAAPKDKRSMLWRLEDGKLTRLAGSEAPAAPPATDGANALSVSLGRVSGLAYDARGNLYLSELGSCTVWRIAPEGTIHQAAGRGLLGTLERLASGEAAAEGDVPVAEATLLVPAGLAADAAGNVYVAELGTKGLAVFADSLNIDLSALQLAERENLEVSGRVRKLTPEGRAITLAGTGLPEDDKAVENPVSVAVDPTTGRVVLVDFGTGQIKEVLPGTR
ncbi:MAG: hypothetical protein VKQ33_07070, partial [Candidatus Sericytochromatia bacterium]|nr:hypothetical protein [Candidatus Sericytochromatia bacterium]